jgi:hypothetical protein
MTSEIRIAVIFFHMIKDQLFRILGFYFIFLGYYLGSLVLGIISINMMLITPLTVK